MISYYKNHAFALLENGYIPTPVIGKGNGMLKGWSHINYDSEFVKTLQQSHANHSIGLLTGKGDIPLVAVDIDIYHPLIADQVTKSFIKRFGEAPTRVGKNPKRLLIYTTDEEFSKIKVEFKDDSNITQAIEILGNGQQFIAFGIHPDTKKEYEWTTEDTPLNIETFMLPSINLDEVRKWLNNDLRGLLPLSWEIKKLTINDTIQTNVDDFLEGIVKPATDFTKDQVLEILSIQSPSCSNDEWVRVGMALKHWDNVEGLKIWEQWSKEGENYQEGETSKRWKSFDSRSNGITLATYYKQYKQESLGVIIIDELDIIEKLKNRIESSLNTDALKKVAKEISSKNFDVFNLKNLISIYRTKYKDITKMTLSEPDCKKLLKFKKEKIDFVSSEIITKPEWLDGWYYISAFDKFYSINNDVPLSTKSFDMKFGALVPTNENGSRPPAAKWACIECDCETLDTALYHPSQPTTFKFEGKHVINTFNINSIPMESEYFTEEGKKAIDTVYNHLFNICSKREDVTNSFIDWLSYNVKYMGVKINYSILLQGIEGIGKSFIKHLMSAVIGSNAREVSPQVVMGAFNEWAEGSSFVAFEELRLQGHNRYDLLNNIKSAVSNSTVMIHKKGLGAYTTPNVTNYIALTNYTDAIPITNTDRRWMVIFAPWSTIAEFEEDVKCDEHLYFDKLFDSLQHYGELRKWLLDWKTTPTFNPTGRAPITEEKQAMVATSHSSEENDHIIELLNDGGLGYDNNVISINHFKQAVHDYEVQENLSGNHLSNKTPLYVVLKNLGFVKYKQIRWDNQRTVIWTKKAININLETIKEMLQKTTEIF